jgi:flagellar biosynthesis protein FlhF
MKIKRFFAKDMRQAIRDVGKELGPDAVIISNSRVPGGIELIAAIDFDETLLNNENPDNENREEQASQQATRDTKSTTTPPARQSATQPNYIEPKSTTSKFSESKFSEPKSRELKSRELEFAKQQSRELPYKETPSKPEPAKEKPGKDNIIWSQEPTLMGIRDELNDIRSMLERQLSSFAWGETARRHPMRARLIRYLMDLGLSVDLCRDTAAAVPEDLSFKQTWYRALANLVQALPVLEEDILNHKGVITLVGPTGVGKTTTVAKLAARYAIRHGRRNIALITTDCFRIGAHEQLRTYGRILDIPVHTVNNEKELSEALNLVCDKDLILMDTAGMSQRDIRMQNQLEMISSVTPQLKTLLVLSATTQYSALEEIVTRFETNKLDGCILTKLDETVSLGASVSTVIKHQLPVAYTSDGQRVPEDIQIARATDLLNRCVSLMQQFHQDLEDESLEQVFRGIAVNANV